MLLGSPVRILGTENNIYFVGQCSQRMWSRSAGLWSCVWMCSCAETKQTHFTAVWLWRRWTDKPIVGER